MPSANQKFSAGGVIRPSRFVKIDTSADFTVLESDANDLCYGISQAGTDDPPGVTGSGGNAASAAGDPVMVYVFGQVAPLELGSGGITRGALLKSDADGKGVAAATTGQLRQNVGAIAEESGSEGDIVNVRVLILPHNPTIS